MPRTYECDNCGCDLTEEEIKDRGGKLAWDIPDIHHRVAPGEPFPFAECPYCECFMHAKQPGTTALRILKEFTDEKGFAIKFGDGELKQTGSHSTDLWMAMHLVEMRKLNQTLEGIKDAIGNIPFGAD